MEIEVVDIDVDVDVDVEIKVEFWTMFSVDVAITIGYSEGVKDDVGGVEIVSDVVVAGDDKLVCTVEHEPGNLSHSPFVIVTQYISPVA